MRELIDILRSGHHSLVIANNGIHTYDGRGVADLYHIYNNEPCLLSGASLADKVVGKGAAAVMACGGVASVYAEVISASAKALLTQSGVSVSYGTEVPYIINRSGDGRCPLESLCENCMTAADCMPKIAAFMNR